MTELMKDILKQPEELRGTLDRTLGPGKAALERAAQIIRQAKHVYITGIGSSWHAGMAVQSLLDSGGLPACLVDASEFLHSTQIARNSAVIVLSRSGQSIEIVKLLTKTRQAGARTIAITNTPESPLAHSADITLNPGASFDHFVSVTMYSALTLVGGLLAAAVLNNLDESLTASLFAPLSAVQKVLDVWSEQVTESNWLQRDMLAYFLARGTSLASCHEARLLWEEAAKAPATALTTGGFRHGPQEMIAEGMRFGLWVDAERMRSQDLAVAADLHKLGGKIMLIGQDLPESAGDLVFSIPKIPSAWQFLIDIMPVQLAAERLSHLRGVDCDSFRICSYIVESEYGLIADPKTGAP